MIKVKEEIYYLVVDAADDTLQQQIFELPANHLAEPVQDVWDMIYNEMWAYDD